MALGRERPFQCLWWKSCASRSLLRCSLSSLSVCAGKYSSEGFYTQLLPNGVFLSGF